MGFDQLRLVPGDVGVRLLQARLEVGGIKLKEDFASLHMLSLGEMRCGDLSIEAGFQRNTFIGFDPPDELQGDRNILSRRHSGRYRRRRRCGLLVGLVFRAASQGQQSGERKQVT